MKVDSPPDAYNNDNTVGLHRCVHRRRLEDRDTIFRRWRIDEITYNTDDPLKKNIALRSGDVQVELPDTLWIHVLDTHLCQYLFA